METTFSKMLVQRRKDAGFPTAYKFYHKNGGQGVLKMTYRNYLMIEQGRTLPPMEKLGPVIWALRITHGGAEANALVTAWLQSMAGEENFREYVAPLLAPKPAAGGLLPMQAAMKRIVTAQTRYLTVEQVRAIHTSPDHYLCFLAITTDGSAWKTADFAGRIKLPAAVVKKALKTLLAAKLVKKAGKDAYRNAFGGAYQRYPDHNTLPEDLKKKIAESNSRLEKNGQVVYPRKAIVRADEKNFSNFFPLIDAHLCSVYAYSVTEQSDTTALFMVENTVTKLRKF